MDGRKSCGNGQSPYLPASFFVLDPDRMMLVAAHGQTVRNEPAHTGIEKAGPSIIEYDLISES